MSRDERSELEQLDALGAELAAAGRVARGVAARGERPDPAWATNLRARLLRDLPMQATSIAEPLPDRRGIPDAPRETDGVAGAALSSVPVERRHLAGRPFAGERLDWRADPDLERYRAASREPVPLHGPMAAAAPDAASASSSIEADEEGKIVALRPAMRWRIPTRITPQGWLASGMAAAIVLFAFIFGLGYFTPDLVNATVSDAASASLVRGGVTSELLAGAALREGDEVSVAPGGEATIGLGSSVDRLAGGGHIRIERLDRTHVVVDQIAGRVYHRVVLPSGGDYEVSTAAVTWRARGTAFDLDRETSSGGEQVRALSLEHGIDIAGPGLQESVDQGNVVTVVLGSDGAPARATQIEALDIASLTDAWLQKNARLDRIAGYPLGELADLATPAPSLTPEPTDTTTPEPTDEPTIAPTDSATPGPADSATPAPTVSPAATPHPTPPPTPAPTPRRTPKPTPRPTPTPTPKPSGILSLGTLHATKGGDGKYTFNWSKYTGSGFAYYKLVAATYPGVPSYGASNTTMWAAISDVSQTAAGPMALDAGDYYVRVQAIAELSSGIKVLAQSTLVHVTVTAPQLPPTVDLGPLNVKDNGDGTYTFTWKAYAGGADWNYYKMPYEQWSTTPNPSYPNGDGYLAVPDAGTTSITLAIGTGDGKIPSGDWAIRIQAIGYPNGAYAYGQTQVLHLIVP